MRTNDIISNNVFPIHRLTRLLVSAISWIPIEHDGPVPVDEIIPNQYSFVYWNRKQYTCTITDLNGSTVPRASKHGDFESCKRTHYINPVNRPFWCRVRVVCNKVRGETRFFPISMAIFNEYFSYVQRVLIS